MNKIISEKIIFLPEEYGVLAEYLAETYFEYLAIIDPGFCNITEWGNHHRFENCPPTNTLNILYNSSPHEKNIAKAVAEHLSQLDKIVRENIPQLDNIVIKLESSGVANIPKQLADYFIILVEKNTISPEKNKSLIHEKHLKI